jgi:hypothetical protein
MSKNESYTAKQFDWQKYTNNGGWYPTAFGPCSYSGTKSIAEAYWGEKEEEMKIYRLTLLDQDKFVPVGDRVLYTGESTSVSPDHVLLDFDIVEELIVTHNDLRASLVNDHNVPLRPITVDNLSVKISVVEDLG